MSTRTELRPPFFRSPLGRIFAGVLAGLLLLVAGCPTSTFHYTPLDRPERIEPKGDYVHAGTGIVFPWSLEGFVRSDMRKYDVDGHEIEVHYKCFRPKEGAVAGAPFAVVSVYVYPAWGDDEAHADEVDQSIRDGHEDVTCLQKGRNAVSLGGREYTGITMRHEYRDRSFLGHVDRSSRTILVRLEERRYPDWFVKYRMSWPRDRTEEVEPLVEKFLAAFSIP
ncbi:MAG: hypothetical protein ABFS86_21000 [Planctomycetota bacterium]